MANPFANLKSTVVGSKKMILFFGAVALIGGGYALSSSPKVEAPTSSITNPMSSEKPVEGFAENSPARNKALMQSDANDVKTAQEKGTTALPTPRPNQTAVQPIQLNLDPPVEPAPVNPPPLPDVKQEPMVIQQPVVNPVPIVAPPTQVDNEANKARTDAMIKYMTEGRNIPVAKVVEFADNKDFAPKVEEQSAPAVSEMTVGQEENKIKAPLPGKILYAEIIGQANSDAPGPVIAKILQGEFTGATLVGSFQTTRDALVISFDRMTVEKSPDGEEINQVVPIKAVAVDTKDIGTGLATSVDRHMLSKLTIGFMSAFAQGFGEAVANKGTTTYDTGNGTITTTNGDLSTQEQLYSAGGQSLSKAGDILDQEFGNRPTTIIVKGGTPIGVLFL